MLEEEAKEVGGMSNMLLGGESQGGQTTLATMQNIKEKMAGVFALISPPASPLKSFSKGIQETPTLIYQQDKDFIFNIDVADFVTEPYVKSSGDTTYVVEKDSERLHSYTTKMMERVKQFIGEVIE